MTSLERLPGDPGLIHETAQALAASGEQLGGLTDVVYGLREAHWDSLAGQRFASRMTGPPRVFSALARRFGLAAQALHAFADTFDLAQRHSGRAAERHHLALDTLAVLDLQIRAARDDVGRARLWAEYAAWDQSRAEAEASWYVALHEYRAADARCAAQLDAAGHDEISDSWPYRAVHIAKDDGARVAMVGLAPMPWTKAIGVVAGAISTAALVTDKVVYDEGSWGDIGASVALSAVGSTGRLLTYASKAGVPAIGPAERLGLGGRLARGVQVEARGRLASWKPSSHVSGQAPRVSSASAGRHVAPPSALSDVGPVRWGQMAGRPAYARLVAGRELAVKSVEQRYLADYRLALRAGPEAQKLLCGAWGVEAGLKAYVTIGTARVYVARREDNRS
ncbi:MAG: hypothetical protein ABI131_08955 [Nostocoides sp.]